MAKVENDGVVLTSPFMVRKSSTKYVENEFDQDYLTIKILDTVKKTGEGEEDYVIVKKVQVEKKPIKEVIDADAESVGVYNIIKQVLRTGDTSLLPVDKGDCNVDLVGAPETLMEVKAQGVNAEAAFNALPKELTKGMDMKSFVENMSQEQFDAFIAAVTARSQKANSTEEVKTNE